MCIVLTVATVGIVSVEFWIDVVKIESCIVVVVGIVTGVGLCVGVRTCRLKVEAVSGVTTSGLSMTLGPVWNPNFFRYGFVDVLELYPLSDLHTVRGPF